MDKLIEKELAKLRLKISCNKLLFAVISVLLSLLIAPMVAALYSFIVVAVLIMLVVISILCCVVIPLIVIYKCIKYKCEFNLEEENDKL